MKKTKTLRAGKLKSSGFTLIELTVVIVLISLMYLIAIPRVRDAILTDDLQKAVTRISNMTQEFRSESVRNHVDYILHINLNDNLLWTYTADSTPEARDEARKKSWNLPEAVKIADVSRFDGEKITDGEFTIRFYKKGYVQPTVLHLTKDERIFTLIFRPFLSSVETHDTYIDYQHSI